MNFPLILRKDSAMNTCDMKPADYIPQGIFEVMLPGSNPRSNPRSNPGSNPRSVSESNSGSNQGSQGKKVGFEKPVMDKDGAQYKALEEPWKDPFMAAEVALVRAKQNSERAGRLAREALEMAKEANKNAKEAQKNAEQLEIETSCCGLCKSL